MALSLCCVVPLVLSGCGSGRAPGQPLDNITAMNTEDTGDWRVVNRTARDGRIALRVQADEPRHAQRIARKVIDQQLDFSPVEVAVDVVPAGSPDNTAVARVVWTRPSHIPPRLMRPAIPDARGSVSSDRQGSPERAVGREEQ